MKPLFSRIFPLFLLACTALSAVENPNYRNYIVQRQGGGSYQMDVSSDDTRLSHDPIVEGGANFELSTVLRVSPFTVTPLKSVFVGSFTPSARIMIRSGDTTWQTVPRTRVDKPFFVDVTVNNLHIGVDDPNASKSVSFKRSWQAYGAAAIKIDGQSGPLTNEPQISIAPDGTAATTVDIDSPETRSVTRTYTYLSAITPATTRVRGQETFSVYSLPDYQKPENVLDSEIIQIWPQIQGDITGIVANQLVGFDVPDLTVTASDVYPGSMVWAQLYKGPPRGNAELGDGKSELVPGTHWTNTYTVPMVAPFEVVTQWDHLLTSDGIWTLELVTKTPWETNLKIKSFSFSVDRTIQVNSALIQME